MKYARIYDDDNEDYLYIPGKSVNEARKRAKEIAGFRQAQTPKMFNSLPKGLTKEKSATGNFNLFVDSDISMDQYFSDKRKKR